jgi:hypothetical protein
MVIKSGIIGTDKELRTRNLSEKIRCSLTKHHQNQEKSGFLVNLYIVTLAIVQSKLYFGAGNDERIFS